MKILLNITYCYFMFVTCRKGSKHLKTGRVSDSRLGELGKSPEEIAHLDPAIWQTLPDPR